MKKPKMMLLTLLIQMVMLAACKKEAAEVDSNFVGNWVCASFTCSATLNISSNSDGTFQGTYWNNQVNESGTVKIKENKAELFIGDQKFHIDEFPYKDDVDTTWKMVLANDTFERPQ